MNFGNWIFVSFVLFAIFIASLVAVCIRQDINLVSSDYYQQEINHQQKINLSQNAQSLTIVPEITISGTVVTITYEEFNRLESGELKLLRPSDVNLDRKFKLEASTERQQHFPLVTWQKGLYRASMQWVMDGREYYIEKLIVM